MSLKMPVKQAEKCQYKNAITQQNKYEAYV